MARGRERALFAERYLAAFKDGMAAFGLKDSVDYAVEARWAEGKRDRLPGLAVELAAVTLAVFVTGVASATIAMAKAAPNRPIVQASGSSPVALGLAASLARRGGMVTGVINISTRRFRAAHRVAAGHATEAQPDRLSDPSSLTKAFLAQGFKTNAEYARQAIRELSYGNWRDYNPGEAVRFYALRLREAGMIKGSPQKLIAQGTD